MNPYQKVLVCIFRTIGVLGLGYILITSGTAALMMPRMAGVGFMMLLPSVGFLLALIFGAIPLAQFITRGIED